jgi:hypothetical protein
MENSLLASVARFFDQCAIKMMIGSLMKEVMLEYRKAGYPDNEIEKLAYAEMMISLKGRAVNVESYYEVRDWKKSYMAEGARI